MTHSVLTNSQVDDLIIEVQDLRAEIQRLKSTGIRVCDKLNMAEDEIERLRAEVKKLKDAIIDRAAEEVLERRKAKEVRGE